MSIIANSKPLLDDLASDIVGLQIHRYFQMIRLNDFDIMVLIKVRRSVMI